jgi:two-component system cell cycle sensor histidine kinase/response regulator CckA
VLLIAVVLVGAAVGLLFIDRDHTEPYILTLLALLATAGVFALFAVASGILRLGGRPADDPLLRGIVDDAEAAIAVSDQGGRVLYANSAYLQLVDARSLDEARPVERVFIGDPDISEAVYRLLKAAREGRRLQEEVRIAGTNDEPARWLRLKVRPVGAR